MRIGNNHGALTAKGKERLGNIPLRWRYDGSKLFMLFREGNSSYLIIQRAFIASNEDSYKVARTDNGEEFILKHNSVSETLGV